MDRLPTPKESPYERPDLAAAWVEGATWALRGRLAPLQEALAKYDATNIEDLLAEVVALRKRVSDLGWELSMKPTIIYPHP